MNPREQSRGVPPRVNSFYGTRKAPIRAYPTKLLRVSRDTFTGTVTFEKQDGVWLARIVPCCLTYLRGLRAQDFRIEIENDGWKWEWLT